MSGWRSTDVSVSVVPSETISDQIKNSSVIVYSLNNCKSRGAYLRKQVHGLYLQLLLAVQSDLRLGTPPVSCVKSN